MSRDSLTSGPAPPEGKGPQEGPKRRYRETFSRFTGPVRRLVRWSRWLALALLLPVMLAAAAGQWWLLPRLNETTDTDEALSAGRISVFPNPAKDRLNVSFTAVSAQNILLEVLSADGRVVLTQAQRIGEGPQLLNLNVAHLTTGLYFVRISAEQELAVEKIMID